MTTGSGGWRIHLTATARNDFQNILRWTSERFGEAQTRSYAETLLQAIDALAAGPGVPGSRRRDKIGEGLMTLHVARRGRKGRHLVLYRMDDTPGTPTVDVLRILHDSMDLARHVSADDRLDP